MLAGAVGVRTGATRPRARGTVTGQAGAEPSTPGENTSGSTAAAQSTHDGATPDPTAPGADPGEVVAPRAAWTYPEPTPGFRDLLGMVAVMTGAVDLCSVDGEVVVPQPGDFYGGWITSRVVGPFKGIPGSRFW